MGKHLVLAGGGHAHLATLATLAGFVRAGHRATLVGPAEYHYYSGMGPGLLSGRYRPGQCRINVARLAMAAGAAFVRGTVVGIDPAARVLALEDGRELPYDVCSFNTGSAVRSDIPGADRPEAYPVKPIENLLKARNRLAFLLAAGVRPRVLVVGGGASGFEIAGAACAFIAHGCGEDETDVSIVAGRGLLPRFPGRAGHLAGRSLALRGIRIFEGGRVARLEEGRAVLADGLRLPCDMVFLASGIRPQPDFSRFGLAVGPDGGFLVDRYLRSLSHPEIFGGGDCVSFAPEALEKTGVYAVRQGPVLRANLLAALDGREPTPFITEAARPLRLLNCGDGRAILVKGPLVLEGAWAMWLKDRIDRAFMRAYQLSGEADEPDDP